MSFRIAARSIALPLVLAAVTSLYASDKKEKYVIINKTKHAVYVVCGNWIDSSINLSPNQKKDFTSHKFQIMHVITLDKDGNFAVRDYLAQNVPGFQKGNRFAFDQGGTYEVNEDGIIRIS